MTITNTGAVRDLRDGGAGRAGTGRDTWLTATGFGSAVENCRVLGGGPGRTAAAAGAGIRLALAGHT
ncbi:MAG: hypothetical protein WBB57_14310, partial [Mycobacterium sp.]